MRRSHDEKIVRVSRPLPPRIRPLSLIGQAARAEVRPRFLLTSQILRVIPGTFSSRWVGRRAKPPCPILSRRDFNFEDSDGARFSMDFAPPGFSVQVTSPRYSNALPYPDRSVTTISPASISPAETPEPGTWVVLATGLVALVLARRRGKRSLAA